MNFSNLGFIHIGMMKTATTYMQNIWLKDNSYSLSWKGTMNYLQNLRKNTYDNKFNPISSSITTDIQHNKGQYLVISNEGFSTAFLNDINNQEKLPQFITHASNNLGKFSKYTPNLLITIREPISWIKSIYIQSIKEGGSGSAQEFVSNYSLFLKHSLNLNHIVSSYNKYFDNILILPYEILKSNEELFWGVISDAFQVPVTQARLTHSVNQSIDLKRTFLLSKLNEMSSFLSTTLINSKNYNFFQEKQGIVGSYSNSRVWINRRFVEFASEEEIDELLNILNIQKPPEDFFDFNLSDDLIIDINKNYVDYLKKNIIPEIAEYYESEFKNFISN